MSPFPIPTWEGAASRLPGPPIPASHLPPRAAHIFRIRSRCHLCRPHTSPPPALGHRGATDGGNARRTLCRWGARRRTTTSSVRSISAVCPCPSSALQSQPRSAPRGASRGQGPLRLGRELGGLSHLPSRRLGSASRPASRPPGSHGIPGRPPEGPLRRSRELGGLSHLPSRRLGSASPSPPSAWGRRTSSARLCPNPNLGSPPGAPPPWATDPLPLPRPRVISSASPRTAAPPPPPPWAVPNPSLPGGAYNGGIGGGYHEHYPPRLRGQVVLCGVARYGGLHRGCDRYRHFRQEQDEERQVRE